MAKPKPAPKPAPRPVLPVFEDLTEEEKNALLKQLLVKNGLLRPS